MNQINTNLLTLNGYGASGAPKGLAGVLIQHFTAFLKYCANQVVDDADGVPMNDIIN